jgi:hypothetical protein
MFDAGRSSIYSILEKNGFTHYRGYESVWIAKTPIGYITVDGDDTTELWVKKDGVFVTDEMFVESVTGADIHIYENVRDMFNIENVGILYALGIEED